MAFWGILFIAVMLAAGYYLRALSAVWTEHQENPCWLAGCICAVISVLWFAVLPGLQPSPLGVTVLRVAIGLALLAPLAGTILGTLQRRWNRKKQRV